MNSMVVSSCSLSPPPCCFFLSACKRKLSSVFLFLFPLEEEEKKEEEEESNLLLVVVAVVILFFDVATSPISSTVADVRIDIVRNDDSDARVRTEEVTEDDDDDDDEAKFRRSFSTSLRGIRRRILCEDDKSFDAPLKLTDAAFLRIFFDAPVFCTRQALVCADLDDVGQDEDMICFFVLTHKSYGSDLSVVSRSRFLLCVNCYYYYYYYYPSLISLRTSRRKGKE